MKTRMLTALLLIACVLPPLFLGGWLLYLLLAVIVVVSGDEILNLSTHDKNIPVFFKPLCFLMVFGLLLFGKEHAILLIGICFFILLILPIFYDSIKTQDVFVALFYIVLFYIMANGFLSIYQYDTALIWLVIITTYVCDSAAYFCGRLFGKHKLNTRISPKKTWEGAIGGWLFSMVFSICLGFLLFHNLDFSFIFIFALILPITGQLGDLIFSAMKRNYNLKDFSNILPGHGGFLDRLDSLLFNFIVCACILEVFII